MVQRILIKRWISPPSSFGRYSKTSINNIGNKAMISSISTLDPGRNGIRSHIVNSNQLIIMNNKLLQQLQQQRYKSFQTTTPMHKEASTEAKTETNDTEDDNEIPEFQNPLHHNNPDNQKIMLDEDFNENETPEIVPLPPLDDGSGKVIAAPHLHDLADEMLKLNMYEMKELVDRISDHFGIEDDDDDYVVGGGGGGAGGNDEGETEEKAEKTAFDLKLTSFDAKSKIKVIKEIRAITGLGLKEAKELVEGAPKVLKKDIKMAEAEELKAKLEEAGAVVEIE